MRSLTIALVTGVVFAAPAAAQSPDPTGDYAWSFSMDDGSVVNGTMNLARTDSGYVATLTSDRTQGPLPTRSVTVNGSHVVVDLKGDFGEFTLDMQLADSIAATYKLETDNGPSAGKITVQRVKRSALGGCYSRCSSRLSGA